eukprot:TRINITY_DN400_c0_g1_i2.p1 TRINITY_DN400_c0_g1~~TRINITY_DN400_c0_g1_i2.p1  ORF type:complete len:344 (+),score=32.77 TRINITY_DN400_c0_g1_i2:69-1100(+)
MIQNTTAKPIEQQRKRVEKDDDEEFVTASIEIEEEASDDLTSEDCRGGINNSGEFEVSMKPRTSVRIGDRFQAVIPTKFVQDCDDLCGELVSAPSDYDAKVESETTKLSVLDSSSQRLGKDKKSIMESWSNSDIEDFEKGMLSYPKQFDKIKRFEMKRSKKLVKDLVEFYYVWKTLERYQDWEDERARREVARRKAKRRLEVEDFDEFYGEKKRKLSEMLLEEEDFGPEPKKRREEEPHTHNWDYFNEENYDSIPFLPPPLEQPEPPSSLWDEPEKPVDTFQNQIENYSFINDDRSVVSHHTPDFLDYTSVEATDQFTHKLDMLAYFPPADENDVFSFMDPLE